MPSRCCARLPDAYPAGDMRTEALFHVALGKMQRGDWEAAKPLLDRIVELAPDDRHWATAGRAEYFRARAAAATGDVEGARTRFVRIVERYPLAFYMLLAQARLAAEDPALAARTLKDAAQRDADGAFPSKVHPILESASIARAVRLLEVGDVEAARREVTASGALGDGVDSEVVWAIGALYNQAGPPRARSLVLARPSSPIISPTTPRASGASRGRSRTRAPSRGSS